MIDINLYFYKEVIEKYEVDKILTPINLGNGELENVILSDLRKALNLCYVEISNSITFKEKLLDYLEDFTLDLIAEKIPQKKQTLKFIKAKRKKLAKQHPNLDYDNADDEVVIEKINALTWEIEQEKYIFHYLKELPFFIRIWVSEKRKEDKDEFLKDWINENRDRKTLNDFLKKRQNKIIKQFKWHILIEPLVSGKISDIQKKSNQEFTKTELSTRIIEDLKIDVRVKDIAPYIQYSFIDNQNNPKNLFSEKKVKTIYNYCKKNKIKIIDGVFLSKVEQYITL